MPQDEIKPPDSVRILNRIPGSWELEFDEDVDNMKDFKTIPLKDEDKDYEQMLVE